MKRRNFIQSASTAVGLPVLLNGIGVSAMAAPQLSSFLNMDSDRVLVIIRLNGGNDGLNTIIPIDQYDGMNAVRSNILIPENQILQMDNTVGFHPNMTGIKSIFDEGQMGIVQSVGYPDQNRSHFRSTDIWTSGSPADQNWRSGWLGRYFEQEHAAFPEGYPSAQFPDPLAITLGNTVSETCQGTSANFSLTLKDPFSLSPLAEGAEGELPDTPYGYELEYLRTIISQTNAYSEVVIGAAEGGVNLADYPEDSKLAEYLRNVALLISGGLQTKIYVVSLGGFDTHANQVVDGDPTTGEHAELLQELSQAVAAFQSDLQQQDLQERVLTMTFSEFGRRIRSNDSFGTDHGTAAPLMLFGGCVNPQILGDNPEVPADIDNKEGVPMQYDFRDVYGSILMDWFEVPQETVIELLHPEFQYLPVINPCFVSSDREVLLKDASLEISNTPNPFRNWTTINFTIPAGWAKLSVFDALGQEIKVLTSQQFQAGSHQIQFDANGLPPGTYFYRLQVESLQKTKRMIKL